MSTEGNSGGTNSVSVQANGPLRSPWWFSNLHRKVSRQPFPTVSSGSGSACGPNPAGNPGAVVASRGDGKVVPIGTDGSGQYTTEASTNDRLVDLPGGGAAYLDTKAGVREVYSATGQIQSMAWSSGDTATFIYSDESTPTSVAPVPGLLIQVSDNKGRSIKLTYALLAGYPGSVIKTLTDAAGNLTTLDYAAGNLSAITWPDGKVRSFVYKDSTLPLALTGIVDENLARYATFEYDNMGRATATEHAGGAERHAVSYTTPPHVLVTEQYDATACVLYRYYDWVPPQGTVVTSPSGSQSSWSSSTVLNKTYITGQSQAAGSGCAASSSAQGYDANGNVAYKNDFNGHRVCYAHDLSRNLETTRVEGLAAAANCGAYTPAASVLPVGSRKVSTEWHPDWSLHSKVAEPGRITTKIYNGQPDPFNANAIASCAPSTALLPDGKPIAVLCKQVERATTDANGSQGFAAVAQAGVVDRVEQWTYNEHGQVLTHDGPRTDIADTTVYTYYTDTVFTGTDPNAVGHTVGDLWTVTNAVGKVTTHTKYDKLGQVLEMSDPNGVVTSYTYDARQRLLTATVGGQTTTNEYWPTGLLKKVTQPDNVTYVQYSYDDAHRLTRVEDNLGNSITYTLDNMGNRTAEEIKDPGGVLKRTIGRSIDALGRVQQVTGRE